MSRHALAIVIAVFAAGAGTACADDTGDDRSSNDVSISGGLGVMHVLLGVAAELKLRTLGLSAGFGSIDDSPTLWSFAAKLYPFDANLGRGPWLGLGYRIGATKSESGPNWRSETKWYPLWYGLVGYSAHIGSHVLVSAGVGGWKGGGDTHVTFDVSIGLRRRI